MSWYRAWLANSLRHQRDEMLRRAARARAARYKVEPMVSNCRELTEAYEEAANVFDVRLRQVMAAEALVHASKDGYPACGARQRAVDLEAGFPGDTVSGRQAPTCQACIGLVGAGGGE